MRSHHRCLSPEAQVREGTASDAAQGLSSSLHQDPDHAKDLKVVPTFVGEVWCFFLALRDLMLFVAGADQTVKLSGVVLTSGEQALMLPCLHLTHLTTSLWCLTPNPLNSAGVFPLTSMGSGP